MKNNNESKELYNKLIKDSEGVTLVDDMFKLPSELDFMLDSYSVDLHNKIGNSKSEAPKYIETPFTTTPGFYDNEKVFMIKAVPFIKTVAEKTFGQGSYEATKSELQEKLNQDDGDTVYFMNKGISSGESSFVLGDRAYENFEEFVQAQHNADGKFGVRFLGINTPEVPHYFTTVIKKHDIKEFKYEDIKDKTNFTCQDFDIKDGVAENRKDTDTIKFYVDKENDKYFEIAEEDFFVSLTSEEKEKIQGNGSTVIKAMSYNTSVKDTVADGLKIGSEVKEMIRNSSDMLIMLDHKTLTSNTNSFKSEYKSDYFSYSYSAGQAPWKTVSNTWKSFFSEERYRYMGYNFFGQDNNKRTLGTIYIKTILPEFKSSEAVWINLSKYMLQKYPESIVALPDYSSDPLKKSHGGFVSDSFKLWTYDFDNQEVLDAFTSYTNENSINERNKLFAQLTGFGDINLMKEHTVLLGDTALVIPPTSIRMLSQLQTKKVPLLRSRGAATKQVPKTERFIEMKMYYNNEENINGTPYEVFLPNGQKTTYYINGLRALIAQFKLTPFLPIENNHINSTLNIQAVTLANLQVKTMPGFPKCLEVTISLQEFDYNIYMPELPVVDTEKGSDMSTNMFARAIHYPAMRWYYQRLLQKGEAIKNLDFNSEDYIKETHGSNTALMPMDFTNPNLEFYLPEKEWLDKRLQIALEREARSIRPFYPIGENGKELIRLTASFYGSVKSALSDKALTEEAEKLIKPYVLDTGQRKIYDIKTKKTVTDNKYRYKLVANNKKKTIANYKDGKTILEKVEFVSSVGNTTVKVMHANDLVAINSEEKNPATSLNNYFNILKEELSSYGSIEIYEELVNADNPYVKINMLVPLPAVIADQTEREEFKKLIITYFELQSIEDMFITNTAQRMCVSLDFKIPCDFYSISTNGNISDMTTNGTKNSEVFLATSTIYLDYECTGMKFLAYCDSNVKKVVVDGKTQYLDYVGNDQEGMTTETQKLNESNYLESETSIKFKKYDFGSDVVLNNLVCTYENSVSRISLNAIDGYGHQFCGGQDIIIEASLITKNEAAVSLLQALPGIASSYIMEYRMIMSVWSLRIKSEITKLFGVNEVLIDAVESSTVPNMPGLYSINIRMTSVDRSSRNREALKRIEGINNSNPMNNDVRSAYTMSSFFDLKRVLGKAEIYPDLELPTIDELEYVGYKIIGYDNGKEKSRCFVDPDFYYIYAHKLNSELIRTGIVTGFSSVDGSYNISDKFGALFSVKPDETEIIKATAKNEVASEIENKAIEAAKTKEVMDIYTATNKKGFNELKSKQKISSRLSQTISGLNTPIWDISNKYSFVLREKQYKDVIKETDKVYIDYIEKNSLKIRKMIDEELSSKIDLSEIEMNPLIFYKDGDKYIKNPKSMIYNTEERVKKFAHNYTDNKDFLLELAHNSEGDESKNKDAFMTKSILGDVLMAYADAQTGMSYCIETSVALNPLKTDEDTTSKLGWKAVPFLNANPELSNGFTVPEETYSKIHPYSKMIGEQNIFTKNIQEAIEKGRTFGIFQIQMFPKKTIVNLLKDNKEKEELLKSKNEYFFLDPYYRKLQMTDSKNEEVNKYKENMIIDPAFCAYAYIRNIMVWYDYLIEEKIAISMYEAVKAETSKQYGDILKKYSGGKAIDAAGGSEKYMNNILKKEEDKNEKITNEVYKKIFEENAEIFALMYSVSHNVKDAPEQKDTAHLIENAVPEELYEYVQKNTYSKTTEETIKAKIKTILKELDKVDSNNDIEDKESEKSYINEQLKILGYVSGDSKTLVTEMPTKEKIISFGTSIVASYLVSVENSAINNQTFSEIYKQLNKPNSDLILGKVMGISLMMMQNGGNILNFLEERDTGALESFMASLPILDATNNTNELERKYVLALDGRGVLQLETIGVRQQSAEELVKLAAKERVEIKRSEDVKMYLRDSYLDMIQNDKRGRMLRAFPTYYMLFIDEGRKIGLWRLHDNFYNMNAISSISVTKSRKIAADTAEISMSNMFKTFSSDDPQRDYTTGEINTARYNMRDAFNSIFSPRTYYMKEEYKRQLQELPRNAQLQPGIRMSIRMGFGANAAELPVVFNGSIAEVGTSDMVDIVAQSDGVELLNPINDIEDAADVANKEQFFIEKWINNWLTNGATPREILLSLLMYRGTWMQTIIKEATKGRFFNYNPYGITHFGDPEFKDMFLSGEVGQNIYEANPRATYGDKERFSGLEEKYMTKDIPVISINLLGKTFWDIMHICASAQPDFIASIVPFGLRSSVFYGSPRYYYAYDYDREKLDDGGFINVEKRKPFQQRHIYSSFTDIIHNNIKASSKNIKTAAVGLYQESKLFGDETSQVGPLFVDFDIYPEFQKSMTVDTQLWAKGLPLIGNAFGWTADLSKTVSDKGLLKIPGAKEIAWRMTANALKNSVRDMYDGELTVIGDPTVKPYDRINIFDIYERMEGECEVEAVVHSFNTQTGFTTSIYADCISVIDDRHEQYAFQLNSKVIGYISTTVAANIIGASFNRTGRPIMNSILKMANAPIAASAGAIESLTSFFGKSDWQIAEKFLNSSDVLNAYAGGKGESAFLTTFRETIESRGRIFSKFKDITSISLNNADDYLHTLSTLFDDINSNVLVNQMTKLTKSTDAMTKDFAINALAEYNELKEIGFSDISKASELSEELMESLGKLAKNDSLDNIAKATFEAASKDAKFLSSKSNILALKDAFRKTADIEGILDVTKKMNGLFLNGDDIVNITKDLSKTIPKQTSIVQIFGNISSSAALGFASSAILFGLETLATVVIGAYASEYIYRYLQNLQVLQIYPLKRKGRAMVAGIDGNKGSVVGSSTQNIQGEWTNFASSMFDGTKNSNNIVEWIINLMFVDENIATVAKKLRADNGVPEPYGNTGSIATREEISQKISKEISSIYAGSAAHNNRNIMWLEREGKFVNNKDILEKFLFKIGNEGVSTPELLAETTPIQEDEEIKKYLDAERCFLGIYHEKLINCSNVALKFTNKTVTMNCLHSQTGAWNLPVLRLDAMILLKDCLKQLFDDLGYSEEEEPEIKVYITSATIVGGKASWENTGLAFRLQVSDPDYTERDIKDFCKKMKDMYIDMGVPNFMVATVDPKNKKEMLFIVKPRKDVEGRK